MIRLLPDCLEFKTSTGESVPCSAVEVTVELLGEAAGHLDVDLVKNAAQSVLHYFKAELGKTTVSVAEFSIALEKVLRRLGLNVSSADHPAPEPKILETDLGRFAKASGAGLILIFFACLRIQVREQLSSAPRLLRFHGLKPCVRHLTGARRWTSECQRLSDDIVAFLRDCLRVEGGKSVCALVVQ